MSLYRRSTVFADVKNMVVSYDTIVASRIERYFKEQPVELFFLPTLKELSKLQPRELVFKIMAEKTSRNFLMDYFDWKSVEYAPNDINPMRICDTVYEETLRLPVIENDILENPDIADIMTSIGKSFQVLCNDSNLEAMYLYMGDSPIEEIRKGLTFFYGGSIKIKFITANRNQLKEFFKSRLCDSYFFEDSSDVDEFIARKHPNLSEVLIPGNNVNLTIIDTVENTNLRNPILKLPLEQYKKDFNLDIHTMGLPI